MDERATERVVTDLETTARIRGSSVDVLVYDLSQGGCMIEVHSVRLQMSDNLRITLAGCDHGGYVVWERDGYAGVKFFRELCQAIVVELGFKPGSNPFKEVEPRDRFGRTLPALSGAVAPHRL